MNRKIIITAATSGLLFFLISACIFSKNNQIASPIQLLQLLAQTQGTALGAPAGSMIAYGGTTPPSGWLLCNGAAVSRSTYAELFGTIGTSFGAGDGSTTFNVPDFRGRFLRGLDGTAGVDPDKTTRTAMNAGGNTGNSMGSIQADDLKSHRHRLVSQTGMNNTNVLHLGYAIHGSQGANGTAFFTDTNNTGQLMENTGGTESRPANASVNFIIKY